MVMSIGQVGHVGQLVLNSVYESIGFGTFDADDGDDDVGVISVVVHTNEVVGV